MVDHHKGDFRYTTSEFITGTLDNSVAYELKCVWLNVCSDVVYSVIHFIGVITSICL